MSSLKIRNATLGEMRYFIDGAKKEGWNPGVDDAVPYYFADPEGFFVGELEGRKIGSISAVSYGDVYGFLGFYIVEPEFRGKGYGLQLWEHAIEYLGERAIGLDGVIAEQDNYRKSGFELYYNSARFGGKAVGKESPHLKRVKDIPFGMLLNYDAEIFGLKRQSFLEHWITMPHSYGLVKMSQDKVLGYGVIRKCVEGYKIGPLFADSVEIAHEIYAGLAHSYQGSTLFLDVIESNPCSGFIPEKEGLIKVFETARMYKKTPPQQNYEKIFGVTSFELG